MKTKVLILHKEPIVERIPSLKALITYLALNNVDVTLLTTTSKKFPIPNFLAHNIEVVSVPERREFFELPTFIKFLFLFLKFFPVIYKSNYALIFAGTGAISIWGLTHRLFFNRAAKVVSFVVEYPNIIHNIAPSFFDKVEIKGIEVSDFYIAHDKLHSDLISSCFERNIPMPMWLPGSTLSKAPENYIEKSTYLYKQAKVPLGLQIILHSGGFGAYFSSKELANIAKSFDYNECLVFHVSHDISRDQYYQGAHKEIQGNKKVYFSMEPVDSCQLDRLVMSAHIGVAWYDIDQLGFRAVNMGLAAGKIGNYLKCGVPVIAPKIASLSYIEEWECGVLVEDIENIPNAIALINENYLYYQENSVKCYRDIWDPDPFLIEILKEIGK